VAHERVQLHRDPSDGQAQLRWDDWGAERKLRRFSEHYARVAEERECAFLDTGPVIASSDLDGIHLQASEHEKLGVAVAAKVRELVF